MNLEVLLDALMTEIVKLNGKTNQMIEVRVESPFVDVLSDFQREGIMKGYDKTREGTTVKWVMMGTSFGCFKFVDKQPVKYSEPPEVEEWREQIGGPGS